MHGYLFCILLIPFYLIFFSRDVKCVWGVLVYSIGWLSILNTATTKYEICLRIDFMTFICITCNVRETNLPVNLSINYNSHIRVVAAIFGVEVWTMNKIFKWFSFIYVCWLRCRRKTDAKGAKDIKVSSINWPKKRKLIISGMQLRTVLTTSSECMLFEGQDQSSTELRNK